MNNDLEQFSEERLKQLASGKYAGTGLGIQNREVAPLARIALAAKQAKPVAQVYQPANIGICAALGPAIRMINVGLPAGTLLYTTTQPAHTEQVIPEWTNEQCLEFLSVAFRHNDIYGEISVDDIRLGVKFALAAAPKPESE